MQQLADLERINNKKILAAEMAPMNFLDRDDRKICFICTQSFALRTLYKGLFPFFESCDYRVHAITGDDEFADLSALYFGSVTPIIIPMKRFPRPWDDIISLLGFISHFRKHRYSLIHVSTPKASLLASIAARLTRSGPIVFVYRRCVYEHKHGWKRAILKLNDKLTCSLAHLVVPISAQLKTFLINERVAPEKKVVLIGKGSSNGIDLNFFSPSESIVAQALSLRHELKIPDNAPVILFLGRILREKGVDFLPEIFEQVEKAIPNVHMIVAGPDESARDPIKQETKSYFDTKSNISRMDFVSDPRALFELSDVFCFPSFFEGFGNVMLEAAAMGTPSVGFDVPGVQEAVHHEVSGLLSEFGDTHQMGLNICKLLTDKVLYESLRAGGIRRVRRYFDQVEFFKEMRQTFAKLSQAIAEPPTTKKEGALATSTKIA